MSCMIQKEKASDVFWVQGSSSKFLLMMPQPFVSGDLENKTGYVFCIGDMANFFSPVNYSSTSLSGCLSVYIGGRGQIGYATL